MPNQGKKTLPIVISWIPHFLSERLNNGEYTLNETMLRGPGTTLSGQKMIDFNTNSDLLQITISARIQPSPNMGPIPTMNMGSQVFAAGGKSAGGFNMNPSVIMSPNQGNYAGLGASQFFPQNQPIMNAPANNFGGGALNNFGGGAMGGTINNFGAGPGNLGVGLNAGFGPQIGGFESDFSKRQIPQANDEEMRRLKNELDRLAYENQQKNMTNMQSIHI